MEIIPLNGRQRSNAKKSLVQTPNDARSSLLLRIYSALVLSESDFFYKHQNRCIASRAEKFFLFESVEN